MRISEITIYTKVHHDLDKQTIIEIEDQGLTLEDCEMLICIPWKRSMDVDKLMRIDFKHKLGDTKKIKLHGRSFLIIAQYCYSK